MTERITACQECEQEQKQFGPKAQCVKCFFDAHVSVIKIGG
jgi:hypothetical protein